MQQAIDKIRSRIKELETTRRSFAEEGRTLDCDLLSNQIGILEDAIAILRREYEVD